VKTGQAGTEVIYDRMYHLSNETFSGSVDILERRRVESSVIQFIALEEGGDIYTLSPCRLIVYPDGCFFPWKGRGIMPAFAVSLLFLKEDLGGRSSHMASSMLFREPFQRNNKHDSLG
jgi:hypothetical protein